MKRKELIKLFEHNGWHVLREGANHTIYTDGKRIEPVPRHGEIKEPLAKAIIKRCDLEGEK